MALLAKKHNIVLHSVAILIFTSVAVFGFAGGVDAVNVQTCPREVDFGAGQRITIDWFYDSDTTRILDEQNCLVECLDSNHGIPRTLSGTNIPDSENNYLYCGADRSTTTPSGTGSTGNGDAGSVAGDTPSTGGTDSTDSDECEPNQACNPLESDSLEELLNRILGYLTFITGSSNC